MRMMIAARLVQRQAATDVSPVRDVALAVIIIAHRDYRSVTLQANCIGIIERLPHHSELAMILDVFNTNRTSNPNSTTKQAVHL